MHRNLIVMLSFLALLSGACALAYEILYMRMLTTLIGDLYYVSAAVLASFIFGIGLGAKLAWRFSRQLYLLEIGTGVYALCLPFIVSLLSRNELLVTVTASPALTMLLAAALIILPAVMIGFSVPLFSAWIDSVSNKPVFKNVFIYYHVGTVISVVLIEFVLIRTIGIRLTVYLAGLINIIVGIALFLIEKKEIEAALSKEQQPLKYSFNEKLALGFASFASAWFQLFFLQLCFHVFVSNRENFTIGISMSLAGLALGAWLVKKLKLNFSILMLLMSASVAFIFIFFNEFSIAYSLTEWSSEDPDILLIAHKFIYGSIFALLPMACFGGLIPALIQREQSIAKESGELIWVSCVSSVIGYIAYVFFIYELMGMHSILLMIILLGLVSAIAFDGLRWKRVQYAFLLLTAVATVVMMVRLNSDLFYAPRIIEVDGEAKVKVYKSGPDDVAFVENPDGWTWITYNGHSSIPVYQKTDEKEIVNPYEMMYGVVPALTAPRLERALVIGFGTGITPGATAQYFKHTDVVEINKAFFKLMPDIAFANLNIGSNPKASLHLSDGRAFLIGKDSSYDAIVSSPPHPDYFSASKLYTLDFFKDVKQALKPDGVFCIWSANSAMTQMGEDSILASLHSLFDYVELRSLAKGYFSLTCSENPINPRPYKALPFSAEFNVVFQKSIKPLRVDEVFEDLRISENIFKYYKPETDIIHTDDLPILEYHIERLKKKHKTGRPFFYLDQEKYNIDVLKAHLNFSPDRFERQAEAFKRFGLPYYDFVFKELLPKK